MAMPILNGGRWEDEAEALLTKPIDFVALCMEIDSESERAA